MLPVLHTIKQLASLGTAQVRDAIFALSSAEVSKDGLINRLQALIRDLLEISSIEADLVVPEWAVDPPAHVEQTLFTIAQEALSNVRRHAFASTVVVTVHVTHERAVLVVQDDGIGISPQTLQTYSYNSVHLGLRGMQRRVEDLAGRFTLVNGEEGGVIVKAVIPL